MQHLISEIEMEIETLYRKLSSTEKRSERLKKLVDDLRTGRKVTDFRFDHIYPPSIRKLSSPHWTPVEVAVRAAELLVTGNSSRILDVGSGCGKFCTVAGLSSPGQFTGIEQRFRLFDTARRAAEDLEASRVSFVHGNMTELDWSRFDAFYLFNPFYENVMRSIRIDDTVSLNEDRFNRYVEIVRTKLRVARPGTRVVTYHGFGGDLPSDYLRLKKEPIGTSFLELWVKSDISHPILKKFYKRSALS